MTNTNRLIQETSPYLLQHAHNPVDWYPWGEEALTRARVDDKPILLSIGYSACHWCHVMERESFENEEIAALMNEHFVSIKVDREERPDLDSIYMEAVQAISGQGGWPMTVFLTPDGWPFFGGTYFPPADRGGLPGFGRVLLAIADAYHNHHEDVQRSATSLRDSLGRSLIGAGHTELSPDLLDQAYRNLAAGVDSTHGGMAGAPKFPQPAHWEFMLRTYRRTADTQALSIVERTLQGMARGGIYDQLGGGFHRYSVDDHWLVPHFEKMLYDNAQLACLYVHAYQATSNADYRQIAEQTLDYVVREMTSPDGGFYSSQDADSEGHEGAFFVWARQDMDRVLTAAGMSSTDRAAVLQYYGVTDRGNFEGKNILHVPHDPHDLARQARVPEEYLARIVASARLALFAEREQRVKPNRDDKIVTAWNGLMVRAFAEAAAVLRRPDYRAAAERAAIFLLTHLRQPDGRLLRTYKDGQARFNGYLEDYAFLADGLLALYEVTFDLRYYRAARELAESMLAHFWDSSEPGFLSTSDDHETLIRRPKDVLDNAIPAGNSVATDVMLRLAAYTGDERFSAPPEEILRALERPLADYPGAFTRLLAALDAFVATPVEIALVGDPAAPEMGMLLDRIDRPYRPNKVVALSRGAQDSAAMEIPLLSGRSQVNGHATAYVCRRFTCRLPVTDSVALAAQLDGD